MYLSEDVEISVLNNRFLQNEANYGGGIYIYADSVISVLNNKFLQNIATDYGGGIVIDESSPLIENNLVAGNTSWFGGGVAVHSTVNKSDDNTGINPTFMMSGGLGEITAEASPNYVLPSSLKKNINLVSEPLLINNTIVDNSATAFGGGIYNENSQLTVLNTILWGNTAAQDSQIHVLNGDVFVEYSDVQDGYTGTGNIDLNPEFLDTTYFLLRNISPCIDTGNPDPIYNDAEDPNNTGFALWPSMGTIRNDMGAYGGPGTINWIITDVDDDLQLTNEIPIGYQLSQNYPNPFNPSTTIEFALPTPGFVTLSIFNILGEKVATLVSENLTAGNYKYHWDAKGVTSGVYLYKLEAGNIILVRKMILIR